jgi:hypothetical protein
MTKKAWIVLLLFFSCAASAVLLWKTDPEHKKILTSPAQIDSLITLTFQEFNLPSEQVRIRSVEIDSLFKRNIYSVRVPVNFSKTSFHYHLHQKLWPYGVRTAGSVEFPDRNLRIHVLANNNVHRSVFLYSDTDLHPLNHQ